MPPKAKQSPEEKIRVFEEWKATNIEYSELTKFMVLKESQPYSSNPDMGWVDTSEDWQGFLNALWNLGDTFKVPGRKCKSFEQIFFRSMWFFKGEEVKICGTTYPISNGCKVDCMNGKDLFINTVCASLSNDQVNGLDPENYVAWRKDLIKALKEWDK